MTTTTWNPSDKNAAITLSTTTDTNDTATRPVAGAWVGVRATAGYTTTGKYYFEVKVSHKDSDQWIAGILNSQGTLASYVGSDTHGCGYQTQGSTWNGGGSMSFNGPSAVDGDVLGFAVDFGNNKIWCKNVTTGSNWNNNASANPATNVNGNTISAATVTNGNTVFPAWAGFGSGVSGVAIINTGHGSASFVGTIPSGFSAWDGSSSGGAIANPSAVTVICG